MGRMAKNRKVKGSAATFIVEQWCSEGACLRSANVDCGSRCSCRKVVENLFMRDGIMEEP